VHLASVVSRGTVCAAMLQSTYPLRPVFAGLLAFNTFCLAQKPADHDPFPGISATQVSSPFPGIVATPADAVLPGFAPGPMGPIPFATPSVLGLVHLEPSEMKDVDRQLAANLHAQLVEVAGRSGFGLGNAEWTYQQIECDAFPDYIFLAWTQGAGKEGSSRFVAILPRDGSPVHIVSAYAHGLLPFAASWERSGALDLFSSMLRKERGDTPLSYAPNWLLIGMTYAEISGYPVQVPSPLPNPQPTLDLLRLNANRPQLFVAKDQSASITFSDISQRGATANWELRFNRRGEITGASREASHPAVSVEQQNP
jgi:hypothetical protein